MGVFLYQSGQRVFWKPVWFSLGSGFIPSRIRTQINIIQKNKTCYFWHKMENCWIKSSHANMWSQTLDLSLHAQDWLPFACSMWIIVIPFEYVSILLSHIHFQDVSWCFSNTVSSEVKWSELVRFSVGFSFVKQQRLMSLCVYTCEMKSSLFIQPFHVSWVKI